MGDLLPLIEEHCRDRWLVRSIQTGEALFTPLGVQEIRSNFGAPWPAALVRAVVPRNTGGTAERVIAVYLDDRGRISVSTAKAPPKGPASSGAG